AFDLDAHRVLSNGVFDQTDSTIEKPPPGMFFGPLYPSMVYVAMYADPSFADDVKCAVEEQEKNRDYRSCDVYARPIHLLHALLLALGVVAIGWSAERIAGRRAAFWLAGLAATTALALEANLFSFVMTESLTFSLFSLTAGFLLNGLKTQKAWSFAASGLSLAALCLTRASFLVLVPTVVLLILVAGFFLARPLRVGIRHAGLFVFLFLLTFTPWIARNALSIGRPAITEEYGSAAIIERLAFNDMRAREFLLAFPYCVPVLGPPVAERLAGAGAMKRFEWNAPGSFFAEGRARRLALVEAHGRLDPVIGPLLRETMKRDWWRHIAVSLPIAWCGAWVSGIWSVLFLPLFAAACILTIRRRDPMLLLYAAPAFVMLALHAIVANHYPRYNLGLIGPFAAGGTLMLLSLAAWAWNGAPRKSPKSAPEP
ncbi:MAG: hypothetical protein AB7K04_08440, partial [Pseudorhodoplanes sp.]